MEQDLANLLLSVQKENVVILKKLQADPEYVRLSPRLQAQAYAKLVRGSPIERLLHLARTGKLDIEKARRALPGPRQAR